MAVIECVPTCEAIPWAPRNRTPKPLDRPVSTEEALHPGRLPVRRRHRGSQALRAFDAGAVRMAAKHPPIIREKLESAA